MQQELFPYSVGIIGTGRDLRSVGWQVAEELCRNSRASHIFLANRSTTCVSALKEYLSLLMSQQSAPQQQEITVCSIEELVEAEPDVTFIALDATVRDGVSWRDRVGQGAAKREDFLAANLPEIIGCARLFRPAARRYAGRILIGTNPVDILTYVFLRESDLDATLVAGFNEGDRERFRRLLFAEFQKGQPLLELDDIEAWVVGPHNELVVPVFSQAMIAGIPLYECGGRDPWLRTQVYDGLIREANRWMGLLGTTAPELAHCMMQTIEAIAQGTNYQPTLSLHTSYRGVPLCIGQRTDMRTGMRPVPMELERNEQEKYDHARYVVTCQLSQL